MAETISPAYVRIAHLAIKHVECRWSMFDEKAEAHFAVAQVLLSPLAFGDVLGNSKGSADRTVIILELTGDETYRKFAAVLAATETFHRRPVWDYNARGDDGILTGQVG
jgi:hypothetical protein